MNRLKISEKWISAEDAEPLQQATAADLCIEIGSSILTQNINIWTERVQNTIAVSTYPLAMWFANSWWRLLYESSYTYGDNTSLSWKQSHYLGAANHGFVWPYIVFSNDGSCINVWSEVIPAPKQSANFIQQHDSSFLIPPADFQHEIASFIERTLLQLQSSGLNNELSELWKIIGNEMNDEKLSSARILEAKMGYDPEECPEALLNTVMEYQKQTGKNALSELAPLLGHTPSAIQEINDLQGLTGTPQVACFPNSPTTIPWKQGVEAAHSLRKNAGLSDKPITNAQLCEFLGVRKADFENDNLDAESKLPLTVGKIADSGEYHFILRKRMQTGRRFEMARLLGNYITQSPTEKDWLVCTDYSTAAQKAQRAFAAEFLCPFEALLDFLDNDFSEARQEEAANHFMVSPLTINSTLINNHYLTA